MRKDRALEVLIVGASLIFGWLCLHTDETGILAGTALVLSVALSYGHPRHFWIVAFLIGAAAPSVQILAHLEHWPIPFPHGPVPRPNDWSDVAGACMAFLFSITGALIGRVGRSSMQHKELTGTTPKV